MPLWPGRGRAYPTDISFSHPGGANSTRSGGRDRHPKTDRSSHRSSAGNSAKQRWDGIADSNRGATGGDHASEIAARAGAANDPGNAAAHAHAEVNAAADFRTHDDADS